MTDEIDVAMKLQEEQMQQALKNRKVFIGESEQYCLECEGVIPEKRRALGGIKLCVFCQMQLEKRGR